MPLAAPGTEPQQKRGTPIALRIPTIEKLDALASASGRSVADFTPLNDDDYARRLVDHCMYFIGGWSMESNPLAEWMKPSTA